MTTNIESLLEYFSHATPLSKTELEDLINSASLRYKTHHIEKRHGRGKRLICQPTSEVKFLQRLLVEHLAPVAPIHAAAVAYRHGASIRDHAAPHAGNRYLLKLDFKDFFPSITGKSIATWLINSLSYTEADAIIATKILCWWDRTDQQRKLAIGAPSSPFISNCILFEFDTQLYDYCQSLNVTYTRYADDLAFSTSEPRTLDIVYNHVFRILESNESLQLKLNPSKTVNVSKKQRRSLVGLVLSNAGKASVGRDAKRRIRASLDWYKKGRLSSEDIARLRGHIAFLYSVDPDFVNDLMRRYSIDKIASIK